MRDAEAGEPLIAESSASIKIVSAYYPSTLLVSTTTTSSTCADSAMW